MPSSDALPAVHEVLSVRGAPAGAAFADAHGATAAAADAAGRNGHVAKHADVELQAPRRPGSLNDDKSKGMVITIQDLSHSVVSNANKKQTLLLLDGVTGFFSPGKLSALMGPSGSGKTTLLDILAGRKTVGRTTGAALFAGNAATQPFLRRYTGYVEQTDTLLPILTVEEMLLYTAELKRPRSEPLASKRAAVDGLLHKLGLDSCRRVKIGNALDKGVSGGQAKRTNIGIALITNPRVLFLDEPTSGLDSFTANEVMDVVRSLADDGVTIVATIHSPTPHSFSLFDSLMMLVRGRVVYFGPTGPACVDYMRGLAATQQHQQQQQHGKAAHAPAHTAVIADAAGSSASAGSSPRPASPGGALLTPLQLQHLAAESGASSINLAEWLVDVFTLADREGRGGALADAYDASHLKQVAVQQTALLASNTADIPPSVLRELSTRSGTATPWWWGLRTLVKYRTTRDYKDPGFLGSRIGPKLLTGLLIFTLFLGIGDEFTPDNYMNQAAVAFMWVVMPAFGAAAYVPSISLERNLFVRERADGLYTALTYLAYKMCDEMAINAVASVVVTAIGFYGIQLQGSYALFLLVYYAVLAVGVVLAYFVAAISSTMDVANAVLPLYVSSLLYFTGFLITFERMPPWWYWFSVINPLRYAWTALLINQFEDNDVMFLGSQTILEYYGLKGQSAWANFGLVWCFFAFFLLCAWASLHFRKFASR